ncbi:MAG TPA: hypothetical protein VEC19_14345 [Usitatibacter sp.]|nr:hypothetical protein [Usitatibacter sp.]
MDSFALLLFPELRRLSRGERAQALRRAHVVPFDPLELLGIAAALIVTALFVRHGLEGWLGAGWARLLAAIAVGALTTGPFLIRRTRRGLRMALANTPARNA